MRLNPPPRVVEPIIRRDPPLGRDLVVERECHNHVVVVGDDVTVYGYKGTSVLARKLVVHRKRSSLSGTVISLTSDGFTLTAADGQHRVIVSASTVVSLPADQTLAAGSTVRASGYLRGDGALLATRITVKRNK